MSEYIKREDVLEDICKAESEGVSEWEKMIFDYIEFQVKAVPSADVVEVGKWYKFGKGYVIECEMNEYGYSGFRIKKATDRDTVMRVFKDGCGERKDGESE